MTTLRAAEYKNSFVRIYKTEHEYDDVELDIEFGIIVVYHRSIKSANKPRSMYFRATTSLEVIVL